MSAKPQLEALNHFPDNRGFFNPHVFNAAHIGDQGAVNVSFSHRGTLRGLHFQAPSAQRKSVTVIQGSIFDVAVDLRRNSPTKNQVITFNLSSEKPQILTIPAGFAHGFYALEDSIVAYAVDAPYMPAEEYIVAWNDPTLAISWPDKPLFISERDERGHLLNELPASTYLDLSL